MGRTSARAVPGHTGRQAGSLTTIEAENMIRVMLADDEPMIRAGVRSILATEPDIDIVAEASDGREAIDLAQRHAPDVALIDIRMPRLDGLAATVEIRRTVPDAAVIILTTFGEDEYISRAIESGASGFLLKSGGPHELIGGVRGVAAGAACLSPKIAQRVLAQLSDGRMSRTSVARGRVASLTPRELEVLKLLGAGASNAGIGRALFLVEGTVKTHVSTIFTRLGVKNRVQAAILAYEAGLVDDVDQIGDRE